MAKQGEKQEKITILDGKVEIVNMKEHGPFGWQAQEYHTQNVDAATAESLIASGCPFLKINETKV